jgi:hypothetical protein
LACVVFAAPSNAGTIVWADWTSFGLGETGGTGSGTITLPGQAPVTLSYAGQANTSSETSDPSNFNVWTDTGTSPTTYVGGTVSDGPTNPGLIGLDGGGNLNTLTFSQAVVNPVMALYSVGSLEVLITYTFSAPVTIESGGTDDFGGGPITQPAGSPNVIMGLEGSGTIQFTGVFTSISWTIDGDESYQGLTVGLPQLASVPEPSSIALGGIAGLVGLAVTMVRRKRSA